MNFGLIAATQYRDCRINEESVTLINAPGGLRAIAISHPHFYTTLVEWSRAFRDVLVHLHSDDTKWVRRPDGCIKFWEGERFELLKGVTLVRGGGHFPGGAMLHWAAGADGKGMVCSADTPQPGLIPARKKGFALSTCEPSMTKRNGQPPPLKQIALAVAVEILIGIYGGR